MNINKFYIIISIILLVFYSFSCKHKDSKKLLEVFCDAEQTAEGRKYLVSSDSSFKILGGYAQSDEQAHSGKFSVKLPGPNSFGMICTLKNVQANDHYQVSVWRKSENNNGILVVPDTTHNKIFLTTRKPVKKDKNGWELLKMDIFVPSDFNEKLKVYVWNNENTVVYFDDLKIIQLPE